MTEKEKIRAEIERRVQLHLEMLEGYRANGNISAAATENVLYGHDLSILSFIDSLQEEPVSEDLEEAIRKYLIDFKGYPHVMDEEEKNMVKMARHFANWQKQRDSSPVDNSLDEEIERYEESIQGFDSASYDDCIRIARHFANWQKEQDKQWLAEEHKNIFSKGWESMREQMMKEAVDGQVSYLANERTGMKELKAELPLGTSLQFGDMVKILVIKQEE